MVVFYDGIYRFFILAKWLGMDIRRHWYCLSASRIISHPDYGIIRNYDRIFYHYIKTITLDKNNGARNGTNETGNKGIEITKQIIKIIFKRYLF